MKAFFRRQCRGLQDIIFQHICGHMGQGGSRARARFCANLCHVAFAKMSALENVSARARCTLQCWTFSKMVHITNKQMQKYVYKKIQLQKYKVHKYKKYENAKCKTTALENGFAQGKSTMDILWVGSPPPPPPKTHRYTEIQTPFLLWTEDAFWTFSRPRSSLQRQRQRVGPGHNVC